MDGWKQESMDGWRKQWLYYLQVSGVGRQAGEGDSRRVGASRGRACDYQCHHSNCVYTDSHHKQAPLWPRPSRVAHAYLNRQCTHLKKTTPISWQLFLISTCHRAITTALRQGPIGDTGLWEAVRPAGNEGRWWKKCLKWKCVTLTRSFSAFCDALEILHH